jgi:hypothetical protein
MKKNLTILLITIGLLFAGFLWPTDDKITENIVAEAMWVSSAKSIDDLASEADVIVHVRVETINETRLLVQNLPISAKLQGDTSDSPVSSGETEQITLPFTDTTFRIITVYKGENLPNDLITVSQTGGLLPSQGEFGERLFEFGEDPLYQVEEEYILFLWDASGDAIHAPNRELYLVMTPFARYRLSKDGSVHHYSELTHGPAELSLPTSLHELEQQIGLAMQAEK